MEAWYLVDPESPSSAPLGPFTATEMAALAQEGSLHAESLVVRAGSDAWIPAADDPALAPLLETAVRGTAPAASSPAERSPASSSRILPIVSLAVAGAALICSILAIAIARSEREPLKDAAGDSLVAARTEVAAAMEAAAERAPTAPPLPPTASPPPPAAAPLPPPQAPTPIEPPAERLGDQPRGGASPDRLPGRVIAQTEVVADSSGAHAVDFTLTTSSNGTYHILAVSEREIDINLAVFDGATLIDFDSLEDHYPTVTVAGTGGDLRFTLQFPPDTRRGDKVEIIVRRE